MAARDGAQAGWSRITHDSLASRSATSRIRKPLTGCSAAIDGVDVRMATNTDCRMTSRKSDDRHDRRTPTHPPDEAEHQEHDRQQTERVAEVAMR